MDQSNNNDNAKMKVKVQVSAKGNRYGEYTFRGDTEEELKANGKSAEKIFKEHVTVDSFIGESNE